MKEKRIQHEIKKFLKDMGFAVWDLSQPRATMQTPGFSDLVAFGHGLILFVEVKTETGKLSEYQEVFAYEVRANGGTYLVLRDVREAWDYLAGLGIIKESAQQDRCATGTGIV